MVDSGSGCAAGSRSRATSRCRCRGPASRTASTARSRRTSRTCTSPTRSSALLDGAARRNVKELLVLTGDDPGHHPGVRERLAALGFDDFVAYVAWCCERALERGLLPHTNLGALRPRRPRAAARGDRQPGADDRVAARPTSSRTRPRRPRTRRCGWQTLRDAEALRIPFTSGILVGIGETEDDRMAALEALAGFGNLQEVILQNFVPHRRYYGEEPAEIATEAAEALLAHRAARRARTCPAPGLVVAGDGRGHGAARARGAAADARGRHPDPAEPRRLVAAARRGGRDRPRRAERQRRPHLARAPVPVAEPGAQAARARTASR